MEFIYQKTRVPAGAMLAMVLFFLLFACNDDHPSSFEAPIQKLQTPADTSSMTPFLFTTDDGKVLLSWMESKGDSSFFKFSFLRDSVWETPQTIASGVNWFENWADFPSVCVGKNGNMLAHYLQKSDSGKFTYDVMITSSIDAGKTWSAGKVLHDDHQLAEHGFVSMVPYGDDFFVTWLDGRNTVSDEPMPEGHDHHGAGPMTLRGAILSRDGNKIKEWELDDRVCDCCQTTAGVTSAGPVVVYRNRSEEEIRDMGIVRFDKGKWSTPDILFPQNWQIKGCPVNGPRMAVNGDKVAVVWFSAPRDTASVHLVFSNDGGKTFGSPVRIDEGRPIGRVEVAWLNDHEVAATWMENDEIKLLSVSDKGKTGTIRSVAASSSKRAAGFPQLTRYRNKLVFAWTDLDTKQVQTALLPIE
jgi:hypothetical protein